MTAPVRTGRVALVEDDDDLRVSTTQLLTLAGFDVVAFPAARGSSCSGRCANATRPCPWYW